MLDSLSPQTRRREPAGRLTPVRGLTIAVVVAGCFFSPLLFAGCSQHAETQSPELHAGAVAAAATVEPVYRADSLTPATPSPPAATPSPPPAAAPTQEVPTSPTEAPPSATEPAAPAAEAVDAPGPASPPVVAGESAAFVSRVVDLINAARRQEGLEPLSSASSLMDAAQRQALAMAEADSLNHTDPDGSTMEGRVQAAGYAGWTALGEVVAAGLSGPEAVVAYWLASPEHRARLLDPAYQELGAGYYYLSSTTYGHWWAVDLAARQAKP